MCLACLKYTNCDPRDVYFLHVLRILLIEKAQFILTSEKDASLT